MAWLIITCSLLFLPTCFSVYYYCKYKKYHYEYEFQSYLNSLQSTKDILDDLELATTQQLIGELKSRPNAEILVLQKIAGGLSMEICGIDLADCPKILQEAHLLAKEACQKMR